MAGFCYWAVVVICAAEIFIAAAAFHRRLLRFLVFLGVGVVHGLVPLLHPAYHITAVWQPSEDAIALAPQLTLMGVAAMATAWHLADFRHRASMSRRPTPPRSRLDVERQSPQFQAAAWKVAVWSGAIALAAVLAMFYFSAGSISAYTEGARFQYRTTGGLPAAIALQFIVLAFVPGFLAFMFTHARRRTACLVYAAAFSGWYYFATRGTRSIPIGIAGAVFVGYLYTRTPRRRTALVALAAVVVGFFVTTGMYAVRRDLGRLSVLEAGGKLFNSATYRDAVNTDPLNYHGQFLAALDHFPSQHSYLDGKTYLRMVLAPVPARLTYGVKPPDTHVTFGETVLGSGTRVSIPPSIPGDGYINFGVGGVALMMFIWGWLGAVIDRRLARSAWTAFWLGPEVVRLLVLFLRGQPYEVMVIAFATWFLIRTLARRAHLRLDVDRGPVAEPNRLEGVRHAMPVHVVPPELT